MARIDDQVGDAEQDLTGIRTTRESLSEAAGEVSRAIAIETQKIRAGTSAAKAAERLERVAASAIARALSGGIAG